MFKRERTVVVVGVVFCVMLLGSCRSHADSALRAAASTPGCGLVGDVDDSGAVNGADVELVAGRWPAQQGAGDGYLADYDVCPDQVINVLDIAVVVTNWGDECATAEWYVAADGSDANDGQSRASAFQTLTHALEVVQPGQMILILPGTYHEFAEVENLGSAAAPIVIRGESGVEGTVVFDGQGSLGSALQCWSCENVVVENLTIQDYVWEGVGFFYGQHITLRDLHVQHTGFGVHRDTEDGGSGITVLESESVVVEHSTVEDTGMKQVSADISGYGIDVWRCIDCTVRDTVVRSVTGTGILVEESCNVTVESNTVENSEMEMLDWWDGGVWLDGGHDVVVRDNVFQGNHGPGIQVSDTEAVYPDGSYGFTVENNVSQNNEFGMYLWNYGVCPPPADAVSTSGNIVSGNRQMDVLCNEWECGAGQPCVPPSGGPSC